MHSRLFGLGHGPQREVDLDGLLGGLAELGDEVVGAACRSAAGTARGRGSGRRRTARFWSAGCISLSTSASGTSSSTSSARASAGRLLQRPCWACGLRHRSSCGRGSSSPQLLDRSSNSLFSATHSSSASGSTRSRTSLTSTRKWSSRSSSSSGWAASNSRMSPALAPAEVLVDLGDDRAGADLVEVVVGRQARRLRLAVQRAGDVDEHRRRRPAGRSTSAKRGLHLAHAVDLVVDLLVGELGPGDLDPQAAVARRLTTWAGPRRRRRRRPGPRPAPAVMSISGEAMTSTSWSRIASA